MQLENHELWTWKHRTPELGEWTWASKGLSGLERQVLTLLVWPALSQAQQFACGCSLLFLLLSQATLGLVGINVASSFHTRAELWLWQILNQCPPHFSAVLTEGERPGKGRQPVGYSERGDLPHCHPTRSALSFPPLHATFFFFFFLK